MNRRKKKYTAVLLLLAFVFGLSGCRSVQKSEPEAAGRAENRIEEPSEAGLPEARPTENVVVPLSDSSVDLMKGIAPSAQSGDSEQTPAFSDYAQQAAEFAVRLFQHSMTEDENTLVSPLSVLSALAMTANGAGGETLSEMESVFGMRTEELNRSFGAMTEQLSGDERVSVEGSAGRIVFFGHNDPQFLLKNLPEGKKVVRLSYIIEELSGETVSAMTSCFERLEGEIIKAQNTQNKAGPLEKLASKFKGI